MRPRRASDLLQRGVAQRFSFFRRRLPSICIQNLKCCHPVDGFMDDGGQRGVRRAGLEVEVDGTLYVHAIEQAIGQGFGARCAET